MASQEEHKRRASIAYILRRRKRGRKSGANSGDTVKSWAEYSEVSYTPFGAYMTRWRWILLLVFPLPVLLPIVIIANGQNAINAADAQLGALGWVLLIALVVIVSVIVMFAVAFAVTSLWRLLSPQPPHKNE